MFERLLARIAGVLAKHKIPYMVIGGQGDGAFIRECLREFDRALDSDLTVRFKTIEKTLRASQTRQRGE